MDEVSRLQQLTPQMWKVLDNVSYGLTLAQACKKAGYKNGSKAAIALKANPKFRQVLNERLNENQQNMKMTRDKVQDMVMEAFDIAKLTSDANAMVRAAAEINKMCGFYEAEQAQINLNNSQAALMDRLNELSDEELAQMSGAASVIDVSAEADAEADRTLEYLDADFTDEVDDDDSEGP